MNEVRNCPKDAEKLMNNCVWTWQLLVCGYLTLQPVEEQPALKETQRILADPPHIFYTASQLFPSSPNRNYMYNTLSSVSILTVQNVCAPLIFFNLYNCNLIISNVIIMQR